MNYTKIYESMIGRARLRKLDGYVEWHHVIPKCILPNNDTVALTPEEHYLAHLLLVKIYPGNKSLVWAAMNMTGTNKNTPRKNKAYGWLRREFSKMITICKTGTKHREDSKEKMRLAKLGKPRQPHTEETKEKMRMAALGKPKSLEHRLALSVAKKDIKRGPHSEETKEKISAAQRGKPKGSPSLETRVKLSAASAAYWCRLNQAQQTL